MTCVPKPTRRLIFRWKIMSTNHIRHGTAHRTQVVNKRRQQHTCCVHLCLHCERVGDGNDVSFHKNTSSIKIPTKPSLLHVAPQEFTSHTIIFHVSLRHLILHSCRMSQCLSTVRSNNTGSHARDVLQETILNSLKGRLLRGYSLKM